MDVSIEITWESIFFSTYIWKVSTDVYYFLGGGTVGRLATQSVVHGPTATMSPEA